MSEQPRLLLCCFDVLPGPTGLSRRISEYLKVLGDRFQVVVLSTKTPDHSHIERYLGARLLRVPVGSQDLPSRIQAFDRAVRRQLESEEYVLAHFFDPFGGYALCESRAQYGFRLVYDALTFPSQELRYTHPHVASDRRFLSKVRRQELYCLMNADAVICGSEVTRDWVLSLGAPSKSLHVFHQPVDRASYSDDVVGEPSGTPMRLLHLGNQLSYQGLQTLLRAMQLALRQTDLRLTVVGPHPPDGQTPLDELAAELDLTGKVELLPAVAHDALPQTLAAADVGVLTLDGSDRNRAQGGPLAKAAEYLAAGRPIVAADLPVTRELIPEAARRLFPPGDSDALAEILVSLASDVASRVKLGEAARQAASKFDASIVTAKLLDLYEVLATRGKVAPSAGPAEVTELRTTGTRESSTGRARFRTDDTSSETLDDEPGPVGSGKPFKPRLAPDEGLRPVSPGEPTPIVKARPKRKNGTDEPTPIRAEPTDQAEPTPMTSTRAQPPMKNAAKVVSAPDTAPPPSRVKRPAAQHGQGATEQVPALTPQPSAAAAGGLLNAPPILPALSPPALPPPPRSLAGPDDEPVEISADDVENLDDEPSGNVDPWLAQLFFGYCPPEAVPFERPAPPTTFPGRDT